MEFLISSFRSNIVARPWWGKGADRQEGPYAISWQFLIDILYIVWRSHRIARKLPPSLSLAHSLAELAFYGFA